MRPDDPSNRRVGTPLIPQRSSLQTPPSHDRDHNSHVAATNIARTQLENIYNGNTETPTPQTTPVQQVTKQPELASLQSLETESPYEKTQTNTEHLQKKQWEQYHSAWQDYYQKYYERYYVGQVYQARQELESRAVEAANAAVQQPSTSQKEAALDSPEVMSRDEAMYDLRSQLLGKVRTSAKKVRNSRHFVPITAALGVMLVFLFLQYNRVLFANVEAYISPGNIDPANIIINPSTNITVSADPKLIIPKINVDVPVIYNTTPDYNAQMAAMENGVAYFGITGANSKPGQVGNTVLSGHSSNDVIDQGSYKFIFARLDHLVVGDTIFVNYQSVRYSYTVTKTQVVAPTDVSSLVYPTTKPILTLITCTPLGTSLNRLLVTAEQVSPDPNKAASAPASSTANTATSIPGSSPTFLQRVFGGGQQ